MIEGVACISQSYKHLGCMHERDFASGIGICCARMVRYGDARASPYRGCKALTPCGDGPQGVSLNHCKVVCPDMPPRSGVVQQLTL